MNNTAKLGLLLPAVLNPATAAVIGLGLIAVGLYRMLPDDDKDAIVDAGPRNGSERAVPAVEAGLSAAHLADVEPVSELSSDVQQTAPVTLEKDQTPTPDADQSEVIRKAMSELGKRSAAARAKKRAERHNGEGMGLA